MVRRFAVVLGCSLAIVAIAACGSVPDVTFSDDGGTNGEGGNPPPPGDGGNDVIVPGCTPSGAEVCDDGKDNDCDGKTDCADSDCNAGFACVDAAPTGWDLALYAASARPACPPGTTSLDVSSVVGDGVIACTCTCGGAGGASCTVGNYVLAVSGEATCAIGATTVNLSLNTGATCTALATNVPVPAAGFAKATPPATPTCVATVSTPPPVTAGRTCKPASLGQGCPGTQVCMPKATAPLAACVVHGGANACPTGFTQKHTGGTAVNGTDTRACNGCTCNAATPCTVGSVSLYDNAQCQSGMGMKHGVSNIGATCAAAAPEPGFTMDHYMTTPPTGGCSATPATTASFSGSVAFDGEETVCCH